MDGIVQGQTWEVYLGKDTWENKEWNPARKESMELRGSRIASRGCQLNVRPRVVWAGTGEVKLVGSPEVFFWFMGNEEWIKKDLLGKRSVLSYQEERLIRNSLTH